MIDTHICRMDRQEQKHLMLSIYSIYVIQWVKEEEEEKRRKRKTNTHNTIYIYIYIYINIIRHIRKPEREEVSVRK